MQTGDTVKAKVVEVLSDGSLILSFEGRLLRLQNRSKKACFTEQVVALRVKKLQPLELQIL